MPTDASHASRRLPAEWEKESGGAVLLAWPHAHSDWAYMLDAARQCYKSLARALADAGQLVVVITPDADVATADLSEAGVGERQRLVVELPTNDTWTRDYGPISLVAADYGSVQLLDYKFNGWGLKFAACHDNLATSRLAAKGVLTAPLTSRLGFVLEGGSIETDGRGTLMVTSRCLLSPNRNGGMPRSEIEQTLKADLGIDNVVWIDHGDVEGDDTDGHIDTLARFAPNRVILFSAPTKPDDPRWETLGFRPMVDQLQRARDVDGLPYSLMHLPLPEPPLTDPDDGHVLPANYANYLVTDSCVLMPVYGRQQSDTLASMVLQQAFPSHRIIAVDCSALVRQHGSLHCATMQLPRQAVCI